MGFIENIRKIYSNLLNMGDQEYTARKAHLEKLVTQRSYYDGEQRQTLAVKPMQADDNITLNFCGLVIDRSVALLLGAGVEFDMGEDEDERQNYIDTVWKANKRDILLQKVAQYGGWAGTAYIKLVPNGAVSRDDHETPVTKIVPLNPLYMQVLTDSEDIDTVEKYIMTFEITYMGKQTLRRETTQRVFSDIENRNGEIIEQIVHWEIINEYMSADTYGKWQPFPPLPPEKWGYEFPPIIHWQNLPWAGMVEGKADTHDVLRVQDRSNFVSSNISKIIRFHAHPKTWGRGGSLGDSKSWGADEIVMMNGENAMIDNLEMQSDLQSSLQFAKDLRQSIFDITRTVDITSVGDKIGALTNFGLRVLFMDTLAKNQSKRELYGEALEEINHRLLALDGFDNTSGGEVIFRETLPVDDRERVEVDQFEIDSKIASLQTIATRRGYNYEDERNRIEEDALLGDNVGAALLRAFNNGQ